LHRAAACWLVASAKSDAQIPGNSETIAFTQWRRHSSASFLETPAPSHLILQRIPHPVQWKVTFRHSTMQISYRHKKNMSKMMMMMMMMIYGNLDAVFSTVLLLPMP
jgi:hypothetical protein